VLDFCGAQNVVPEIQLIRINKINDAYEKIVEAMRASAMSSIWPAGAMPEAKVRDASTSRAVFPAGPP
jgi:hypothetical protein